MIPLRLQLKNFMSYGEGVPPLDLTGMRLVCLSGDNGNGKTALLDAMTWALFGETRASSDDDVIRLGATDCQVLFDFQIGESEYRIHRARGRRGGAAWELQIRQEDGSTRSLSGTNARETKAKIEQILRMDYQTFLASGYLAQGRADEFARATVADRKKVLADILDLSRYERLEQLARERRKEAEDRETDAERDLRAIEAELEHEDRYHLAVEAAETRLVAATAGGEVLRAEYDALFAAVQRLEEREAKAREYEARIPEIEGEITGNRRQLAEIGKRLAEADAIIARGPEIERVHKRAGELREQIAPLETQYDAAIVLQREAREIERRVRDAFDALDRERYRLDSEVKVLEKESEERERYESEMARVTDEIAGYGDMTERHASIEERRINADEALVEMKALHATFCARRLAVQKRLDGLSSSDLPACEYCGQALPPEKRHRAVADANAEKDDLTARERDVVAQGRDAKKAADLCRTDSEQLQKSLRTISTLEARHAQATQEHLRIVKRTEMLPDLRRRREAYEGQIARREYAVAEQERLVAVSARLEKLERVTQQLTDARTELARCENAERDLLKLQAAHGVRASEPVRAGELSEEITRRESQIGKARKQISEIRTATGALPERHKELAAVSGEMRRSEEQARLAEREIGQGAALLARCADLKIEKVRRTDERVEAAREKDLYKELIGAFGKKGVQALIIENALPEIEAQANELLSRMTDGAMQLRLLTQREAKTRSAAGASIETLDIIISDDMGTRPYEMYSGGEAFRINFALRIALSRLLANRAGAPLQTLILDEGFGTQDPRGREALVDAINSIADSFALILVITHIEEMKEAFNTRIEVTKGPRGSTFTIA